jgi:hypothetical protein
MGPLCGRHQYFDQKEVEADWHWRLANAAVLHRQEVPVTQPLIALAECLCHPPETK